MFYPTLILEFLHTGGDTAYWLLDPTLTYVAATVSDLPGKAQAAIARRIAMIKTFLDACGDDAPRVRVPDDVASLEKLAASTRQETFGAVGHLLPGKLQEGRGLTA